jgi:dienelactone hydrolase
MSRLLQKKEDQRTTSILCHSKTQIAMIKKAICIFLLLSTFTVFGQSKTPEDFGFRHIVFTYKKDNIDILVKSKRGEENTLSQPYPTYTDSTGKYPKEYSDRNLLTYYTQRNIEIIKYLQKQKWVSSTQVVVAGHSEGSSVAAKMASECKKITHLIYSGGNPFGRIMSIIGKDRTMESDTDSTRFGEESIMYWKKVVENKNSMDALQGDTDRATYEFSYPMIKYLEKLKIPVLLTYGTKDESAPFNDFLHVETIRQEKRNFTFKAYVGTEHNFFPLTEENKPNYNIFNWNKVASDWLKWLNEN